MASPRKSVGLTATRLARLYRLLSLIATKASGREQLLKKLKIDLRSFYRDLEKIRELGIRVSLTDGQYRLQETLDAAAEKIPFPDPQFSLGEVLLLSEGTTAAHERLRNLIASTIPKDLLNREK
jgi:predicted DNA-binding transcriptional regulator YafY